MGLFMDDRGCLGHANLLTTTEGFDDGNTKPNPKPKRKFRDCVATKVVVTFLPDLK